MQNLLKLFAILGRINRIHTGPDNRHAGRAASARAKFKGVCPPNWTITPSGCTRSQMFSTSSVVSGSKNSRSLVS